MFKGITDRFKLKSAQKFLSQQLDKVPFVSDRGKGLKTVGCIVDLDKFDRPDVFYELIEDYGLRPNAVRIIGYKGDHDKNSPYSTPVVSENDLGWNGKIESGYALEFLSRDYDLLLNYYDEPKVVPQLISVKAKARVKVGFGSLPHSFNDLILNLPMNDFKLFRKELKKYLKVFNEI